MVESVRTYVSNTHAHVHMTHERLLLEKWFPLQGERAHFLNFLFFCMYVKGETEQLQSYQFTQDLTITFIIHNQYVNTLFIYIHTIHI